GLLVLLLAALHCQLERALGGVVRHQPQCSRLSGGARWFHVGSNRGKAVRYGPPLARFNGRASPQDLGRLDPGELPIGSAKDDLLGFHGVLHSARPYAMVTSSVAIPLTDVGAPLLGSHWSVSRSVLRMAATTTA